MGHLPCKYVEDVRLIIKRKIHTGSSQADMCLALDHGVGVRVHNALGVHGTSDLMVGVRVHGASDLGVGSRMHNTSGVHGASDLGVGVRVLNTLGVPSMDFSF